MVSVCPGSDTLIDGSTVTGNWMSEPASHVGSNDICTDGTPSTVATVYDTDQFSWCSPETGST